MGIDVVELTDAVHEIVGFEDREMIVRLMNEVDRNKDDSLDWREFSKFIQEIPHKDLLNVQRQIIARRTDKTLAMNVFIGALLVAFCVGTVVFTLRGLERGREPQNRKISLIGAGLCGAGVVVIFCSQFCILFIIDKFRERLAVMSGSKHQHSKSE